MSVDISNKSAEEIEEDFPSIHGRYRITSQKDPAHNCIAYVVGDLKSNWDPGAVGIPGYYWPPGFARDDSLSELVNIFEVHGYRRCETAEPEIGFTKIAIYGDQIAWTHAAYQLESGKWSSKLGLGHDVEHDSLDALNGDLYGAAVVIMRRVIKSN